MSEITITAWCNPKALKRHRRAKSGHNYDPSATDKDNFLAQVMQMRPEKPFEGPLRVNYSFGFSRPRSHYGKNGLKPNAPKYRDKIPDKTNVEKLVEDAMNGIFYRDDAQIVTGMFEKVYAEQPYIQITITELDQ